MSITTQGLKSKEIKAVAHTTNCQDCGGTGSVHYGQVHTVEKGLLGLFDDCGNCDGRGKIVYVVKKAVRRRKSKVEIL